MGIITINKRCIVNEMRKWIKFIYDYRRALHIKKTVHIPRAQLRRIENLPAATTTTTTREKNLGLKPNNFVSAALRLFVVDVESSTVR